MSEINKSKRDITIDFIRGLSCIAVVIIHCVAIYWIDTPIPRLSMNEYWELIEKYQTTGLIKYNTITFYLYSFIDAVMRFAVPVFIMLSGYLVLNKTDVDITYSKKKSLYVIKLCFLWGLIMTGFDFVLSHIFKWDFSFVGSIPNIVSGPSVFWFMWVLLPLYMVSPIFFIIMQKKETASLFVITWFAFSLVYPFICDVVIHHNLIKFQNLQVFSGYCGFFVVGGYIAKYEIPRWLRISIISLAPLALLIMAICQPVGYYHNYLTPLSAVYSIGLLLLLLRVKKESTYIRFLSKIGSISLGVFALHPLIIKVTTSIFPPLVVINFYGQ